MTNTGADSLSASIKEKIDKAKSDPAFQNYLMVRDWAISAMEDARKSNYKLSSYWEEETEGFEYIVDCSPLIVSRLREHCYHITGTRPNEYRSHHSIGADRFAARLEVLEQRDRSSLFVPESPEMGGFGHLIDGRLINRDTLRFYDFLINLDYMDALDPLRDRSVGNRPLIVEIGAGWGGLAYQMKTLFPDNCYVIVDLPQTMLFSAVYLKTLFPQKASIFISSEKELSRIEHHDHYDFVFIPSHLFAKTKFKRIDLAVNMSSFQEMTSEQVSEYVEHLYNSGCKYIFSYNRNRSPYNRELSSVGDIISRFYSLREPIAKEQVARPDRPLKVAAAIFIIRRIRTVLDFLRRMKSSAARNKSGGDAEIFHYRYLLGTRRN